MDKPGLIQKQLDSAVFVLDTEYDVYSYLRHDLRVMSHFGVYREAADGMQASHERRRIGFFTSHVAPTWNDLLENKNRGLIDNGIFAQEGGCYTDEMHPKANLEVFLGIGFQLPLVDHITMDIPTAQNGVYKAVVFTRRGLCLAMYDTLKLSNTCYLPNPHLSNFQKGEMAFGIQGTYLRSAMVHPDEYMEDDKSANGVVHLIPMLVNRERVISNGSPQRTGNEGKSGFLYRNRPGVNTPGTKEEMDVIK